MDHEANQPGAELSKQVSPKMSLYDEHNSQDCCRAMYSQNDHRNRFNIFVKLIVF